MTPIIHNYTSKAGKSFAWDTSDNQQHYLKNMENPELRQRLTELGYVDRPIEYCYNAHGFRSAEFDQAFDIACFGCSFTMGTGIYTEETWPNQLASQTGLTVANLGHAGSSNDTAFRFANHYLKWLKPRVAIWLQTDRHRVELLDDAIPMSLNIMAGDTSNPCARDRFIKTWFSNDTNQQLNLEKNTLAFQQLCQTLGIKCIILGRRQIPLHGPFPHADARDLTHPGANIYRELVQRIIPLLDSPDANLCITEAHHQ